MATKRKAFGVLMDGKLVSEVDRVSKLTGIRKQAIVEVALRQHLTELEYLHDKKIKL